MLWNLDDLPIFLAVAEHQGISSAADYLGMAKSSVSKAITRLEKGLGVRLFERNSRQFRITHEGEAGRTGARPRNRSSNVGLIG